MKKWYINLHWFKKILVHILMFFLFLVAAVGVAETDTESLISDIFLAIWILIIIMEILFLKWSGKKYRNLKTKTEPSIGKAPKSSYEDANRKTNRHESESLTKNKNSLTTNEKLTSVEEDDKKAKLLDPVEKPKRTHFDKVRITDDADSHSEEYAGYYKITDPDHCLYIETGRTYHTHIGCYLNWPEEMQEKFEGWRLTTVKEAESKGLRKCRFCEEADLSPEERFKKKYGDRPFITAKLVKTGKSEIQENLSTQNEGVSVTILCDTLSDDLNDVYMVEDSKFGCTIGYLSQTTINKLKKISDDIEMFDAIVHKVELNDNLKWEIEILIFTDV